MAQLHPEPEMNKEGHSSCHFLHRSALARSWQQRCTAPEQPRAPRRQRGPPCGHSTAPAASADSRKPGSGPARACVRWPFPTSLAMLGANRAVVGAGQRDLTALLALGPLIPLKAHLLLCCFRDVTMPMTKLR